MDQLYPDAGPDRADCRSRYVTGLPLNLPRCSRWLVLLAGLCLPLLLSAADVPRPGTIIDLQAGQVISAGALLQRLRQSPQVLIGEKHDNPGHHQLELQLVRQLVDSRTSVTLEMLDETLAARIPAAAAFSDAEQLRQQLQWQDDQRGWPWRDYGAIMAAVLEQGGRLQAGNISRDTSLRVYQGDSSWEAEPRFATVQPLRPGVQAALLELVYSGHCATVPRDKLGPVVTIQLLKDAAMAAAMVREVEGMEVARQLLISGAVHARKDIGVPRHLQLLNSAGTDGQAPVTVLLQEVDSSLDDWRKYPQATLAQADYLWFTDAVPAQDYCASLRQR